jgi:TPR repeat protein
MAARPAAWRGKPAGVAALFVALAAGGASADFRQAVGAYERGDFATAARELQPLAEGGDAEAQFYVGYMHESGKGFEQDLTAAAEWYRKAAEQGHARAAFNLGLAYEAGRGVPADPAQALEQIAAAADGGFARAQYKAAEMYLAGTGTRRDLMLAYQWFKLAGAQRYADAKKRRKQIAREMTPHQIAEADMHVRMWREEQRR